MFYSRLEECTLALPESSLRGVTEGNFPNAVRSGSYVPTKQIDVPARARERTSTRSSMFLWRVSESCLEVNEVLIATRNDSQTSELHLRNNLFSFDCGAKLEPFVECIETIGVNSKISFFVMTYDLTVHRFDFVHPRSPFVSANHMNDSIFCLNNEHSVWPLDAQYNNKYRGAMQLNFKAVDRHRVLVPLQDKICLFKLPKKDKDPNNSFPVIELQMESPSKPRTSWNIFKSSGTQAPTYCHIQTFPLGSNLIVAACDDVGNVDVFLVGDFSSMRSSRAQPEALTVHHTLRFRLPSGSGAMNSFGPRGNSSGNGSNSGSASNAAESSGLRLDRCEILLHSPPLTNKNEFGMFVFYSQHSIDLHRGALIMLHVQHKQLKVSGRQGSDRFQVLSSAPALPCVAAKLCGRSELWCVFDRNGMGGGNEGYQVYFVDMDVYFRKSARLQCGAWAWRRMWKRSEYIDSTLASITAEFEFERFWKAKLRSVMEMNLQGVEKMLRIVQEEHGTTGVIGNEARGMKVEHITDSRLKRTVLNVIQKVQRLIYQTVFKAFAHRLLDDPILELTAQTVRDTLVEEINRYKQNGFDAVFNYQSVRVSRELTRDSLEGDIVHVLGCVVEEKDKLDPTKLSYSECIAKLESFDHLKLVWLEFYSFFTACLRNSKRSRQFIGLGGVPMTPSASTRGDAQTTREAPMLLKRNGFSLVRRMDFSETIGLYFDTKCVKSSVLADVSVNDRTRRFPLKLAKFAHLCGSKIKFEGNESEACWIVACNWFWSRNERVFCNEKFDFNACLLARDARGQLERCIRRQLGTGANGVNTSFDSVNTSFDVNLNDTSMISTDSAYEEQLAYELDGDTTKQIFDLWQQSPSIDELLDRIVEMFTLQPEIFENRDDESPYERKMRDDGDHAMDGNNNNNNNSSNNANNNGNNFDFENGWSQGMKGAVWGDSASMNCVESSLASVVGARHSLLRSVYVTMYFALLASEENMVSGPYVQKMADLLDLLRCYYILTILASSVYDTKHQNNAEKNGFLRGVNVDIDINPRDKPLRSGLMLRHYLEYLEQHKDRHPLMYDLPQVNDIYLCSPLNYIMSLLRSFNIVKNPMQETNKYVYTNTYHHARDDRRSPYIILLHHVIDFLFEARQHSTLSGLLRLVKHESRLLHYLHARSRIEEMAGQIDPSLTRLDALGSMYDVSGRSPVSDALSALSALSASAGIMQDLTDCGLFLEELTTSSIRQLIPEEKYLLSKILAQTQRIPAIDFPQHLIFPRDTKDQALVLPSQLTPASPTASAMASNAISPRSAVSAASGASAASTAAAAAARLTWLIALGYYFHLIDLFQVKLQQPQTVITFAKLAAKWIDRSRTRYAANAPNASNAFKSPYSPRTSRRRRTRSNVMENDEDDVVTIQTGGRSDRRPRRAAIVEDDDDADTEEESATAEMADAGRMDGMQLDANGDMQHMDEMGDMDDVEDNNNDELRREMQQFLVCCMGETRDEVDRLCWLYQSDVVSILAAHFEGCVLMDVLDQSLQLSKYHDAFQCIVQLKDLKNVELGMKQFLRRACEERDMEAVLREDWSPQARVRGTVSHAMPARWRADLLRFSKSSEFAPMTYGTLVEDQLWRMSHDLSNEECYRNSFCYDLLFALCVRAGNYHGAVRYMFEYCLRVECFFHEICKTLSNLCNVTSAAESDGKDEEMGPQALYVDECHKCLQVQYHFLCHILSCLELIPKQGGADMRWCFVEKNEFLKRVEHPWMRAFEGADGRIITQRGVEKLYYLTKAKLQVNRVGRDVSASFANKNVSLLSVKDTADVLSKLGLHDDSLQLLDLFGEDLMSALLYVIQDATMPGKTVDFGKLDETLMMYDGIEERFKYTLWSLKLIFKFRPGIPLPFFVTNRLNEILEERSKEDEKSEYGAYGGIDLFVVPLVRVLCEFERLTDATRVLTDVIKHYKSTKYKFYRNCSLWTVAKELWYYCRKANRMMECEMIMQTLAQGVVPELQKLGC